MDIRVSWPMTTARNNLMTFYRQLARGHVLGLMYLVGASERYSEYIKS